MKEYTILAICSVFVAVLVDKKTGINILKRRLFFVFLAVIALFKFLVNGFLTGASVVIYNPDFFLGLRLGPIPLEDFLFGFSMVTMVIIFWEYFKKKERS